MSKSSRKDNQKGILTPVSWAKSHEPKWFIVRESYIVVVDEPDELQVYDVFLIDGDFAIEGEDVLEVVELDVCFGRHLEVG